MIGWQAGVLAARRYESRDDWEGAAKIYQRMLDLAHSPQPGLLFRLGYANFRLDDISQAEANIRRAVELAPDHASWWHRLGFIQERTKRFAEAIESYGRAIDLKSGQAEWHYRLGKSHLGAGDRDRALAELARATELRPDDERLHRAYVETGFASAPTWRQVEILEAAVAKNPSLDWLLKLGNGYLELSRYADSISTLEAAVRLEPENTRAHYALARAFDLHGAPAKAAHHFRVAAANSTAKEAQQYGPGALAQATGDWPLAADYYARSARHDQFNAVLQYRLGLAHERSYNWTEAQAALERAVRLEPGYPKWHYRLGFVLERRNKWARAAEAYRHAIATSKAHVPEWHYRLGTVLRRSNDLQQSIEAFLRVGDKAATLEQIDTTTIDADITQYERTLYEGVVELALQSQDPQACHSQGKLMLSRGQRDLAVLALVSAVDRNPAHDPSWYRDLGVARYLAGDLDGACEALARQEIFQRPDGIDRAPYLKNAAQKEVFEYAEYLESLPLRRDTILYESHFGGSVDCNPLALCEAALADARYDGFNHVWVCNEPGNVPEQLRGRSNVSFIPRKSDAFRRYLATAEYLVNNVTFPHYFIRREGQKYLNTWHGTPLKTLGADIRTGFMEHANVSRNFLQATHLQVPNDHTENILMTRYDVEGLARAELLRHGTPRIDRSLNSTDEDIAALRERLDIPANSQTPVVLYAPTWRGSTTSKRFEDERLVQDLSRLRATGAHVLFRAHHMTEQLLTSHDLADVIVPRDIDTNTLLAAVDVLITDYSSIFFDFLPLRRKILFYAYDLEEYQEERGLYFDLADMPGVLCKTIDTVCHQIESAMASQSYGLDPQYEELVERFCPAEDGRAAAKVLAAFLNPARQSSPGNEGERPIILFHQSLLPNGITSAFINLVKAIDPTEYRVVLLFDPQSILREDARRDNFDRLPSHVQRIARIGGMVRTIEERWVGDKIEKYSNVVNEQWERLYASSFGREARRLFGSAAFDTVIEFDGYAPFWIALAAQTPCTGNHVVYLHNTMEQEWLTKYPYLRLSFQLMQQFEGIASVSAATNALNADFLSNTFDISDTVFSHVDNLIDHEDIREQAAMPLDEDIEAWLGDAKTVFVNIGRMSPEKDQQKLICAFEQVLTGEPDARLVILGDGPLKAELAALVRDRGLGEQVLLAGHRRNPFSLLSRCTAFVLSSDHEGQPMVLLESMALGTTIVATDIPANRGVVDLGYGILTTNDAGALAQGMLASMGQQQEGNHFDAEEYKQGSIELFDELLIKSPAFVATELTSENFGFFDSAGHPTD